jgi:integrase
MKHKTESNTKTLVDKWIQRARLTKSTEKTYRIALEKYCELHDMTPEELKKEAEADLRAGLLPSELKILDRYYDYLEYLDNQNMSPGTINVYKAGVRSFYRSFVIEIPKINNRGEKVAPLEQNLWHGFTKEEVNRMLRVCSLRDRAIILLISSSGLARQEIINLKRSDFQDIDNQNIATIRIRRKKVGRMSETNEVTEVTREIPLGDEV